MTQDASKETMAEETPVPEVPEAEPVTFPEAETDPPEAEMAELKEEAGKLKDQLLRTLADMDNLRKRMERERARRIERQRQYGPRSRDRRS